MKRIFILMFGVVTAAAALAQTAAPAAKATGAEITWEKATHDFGDIHQGDVVEFTYKFTNTGTEPLIITNVQPSCGCTTPKGYPRDPVAAGAKGEITIAFNSTNKSGMQNKVIGIVSNAVNPESKSISFTTNVLEKKTPQ